jgi:energy-coupling factor transporter ATP-binding protein EcfA2
VDGETKKRTPTNGLSKGEPERPVSGSYFVSLELEHIRCFGEKQTLELSDRKGRPAQWTILLGENGTGKTTILQALSAFEPIPIPREEYGPGKWHLRFDARALFVSEESYLNFQSFLRESSYGWIAAIKFTAQHILGSEAPTQVRNMRINGSKYGSGITTPEPLEGPPPVSYAYGTGRRIGASSLALPNRNDSTESLFSDDVSLRNAEEWLLQLDYSAVKPSKIRDRQKQRLQMVKDVLVKVLPDVSAVQVTAPTPEKQIPGVEFKTPYGWVPLSQLGYGYRTMIAWVIDFASRMVERYPDSPDPLAEPAVVLVDEIDLHLHPKWQRELIGFLTERFPNTQFIVTAHSPLIVQSAPDANIALLKRVGDHVVIENNPETIRGWRVDQILTSGLFGLESARPPDTEKLLLRRKALLTKPRLTGANAKELEEINKKIGPLPTGESFEQAKSLALIERSLNLLKKHQGKE